MENQIFLKVQAFPLTTLKYQKPPKIIAKECREDRKAKTFACKMVYREKVCACSKVEILLEDAELNFYKE